MVYHGLWLGSLRNTGEKVIIPNIRTRPLPQQPTKYTISNMWYFCPWSGDDHDDVIKWKYFPRHWPVCRKGQWRGFFVSMICALNKRLSIQSWCWWFEMPCNVLHSDMCTCWIHNHHHSVETHNSRFKAILRGSWSMHIYFSVVENNKSVSLS